MVKDDFYCKNSHEPNFINVGECINATWFLWNVSMII